MTNIKSRARFVWDLGGRNPFVIFRRLREEIDNRLVAWDLTSRDNAMEGSLSNTPTYLEACEEAVKSEAVFLKFRSCRSYRKILEHVSPRTGEKYLSLLDEEDVPYRALKELIPIINIGGPAAYHFETLGKISPTSLRYAKVHNDLRQLFGSLANSLILEIGCGYGGLAAQITWGEKLKAYDIVDLEVVETLAMKYVTHVNPRANNIVRQARFQKYNSIDILVSNYAFSELSKNLQDDYLEKFILKSKKGYMIYNHINPPEFLSYTAEEICEMIPGSEIVDEVPLTDKTNVLIIWGHKLN